MHPEIIFMKTFRDLILLPAAIAFIALAPCATAEAASPKASRSVTNTVAAIPKSVFDEAVGKDPFFPRRSVSSAAKTAVVSEARVSDFALNGITPFGSKPNAIINGRTLEKGESGEVKVPGGGRVLIHCVDIKEGSVTIRVENSPQTVELRMRPGL